MATKMNVTPEKALRWAVQGLGVVLVLVVAVATMFYMKIGELESSLTQARSDAEKATQASAAARKKVQDELKAAAAKLAALEQQQVDADKLKTLLGKAQPQIAAALEAAAGAKTAKPEARAAALAGLGVVGQIAGGKNNEAALAVLDRALAADKANCIAGLGVNLGGAKQVEVAPDCQALLPAAAASDAKPAPEAKPAADAKPQPAPAAPAGKAAPGAGKG